MRILLYKIENLFYNVDEKKERRCGDAGKTGELLLYGASAQ